MALFYANENFALAAVEELRRLGHDVLTIQQTGSAGQALSDEAVLAVARQARRTLLTFNRKHFIRLHGDHPDHEGIVACTLDADFIALASRIHAAVSEQSGKLSGQLIRINRPSV